MNEFTGASVNDITLKKQSDVVIKKILSHTSEITLPEGVESLEVGTVLVSIDGGETYDIATEDSEANGILCENITENGEAEVLLIGVVRQRYLAGYLDPFKEHLFNNKIIVK